MNAKQVADDVLYYRTMMVNVFVVGDGGSCVLVDAGLSGYEESIRARPGTSSAVTHRPRRSS